MEWFNDHKYNNNLVRVHIESRKAINILLQIVLGANKNKLPKGNRKDSGKQKCVSERTLACAVPRKSRRRERDGRASVRLQVSRPSSKSFKICRLNSILHCSELKIY